MHRSGGNRFVANENGNGPCHPHSYFFQFLSTFLILFIFSCEILHFHFAAIELNILLQFLYSCNLAATLTDRDEKKLLQMDGRNLFTVQKVKEHIAAADTIKLWPIYDFIYYFNLLQEFVFYGHFHIILLNATSKAENKMMMNIMMIMILLYSNNDYMYQYHHHCHHVIIIIIVSTKYQRHSVISSTFLYGWSRWRHDWLMWFGFFFLSAFARNYESYEWKMVESGNSHPTGWDFIHPTSTT